MTDFVAILTLAFLAWLSLTVVTYMRIRVAVKRHGVPDGWRFNHKGASMFPGHLSFYGDSDGVVLRAVIPLPLFWTVKRGHYRGDLERIHTTTVFSAFQRVREVMEPEDGGRGLICLFCGRDGFSTPAELDEHIDDHPYTVRRGENGG